jgi:hypothetical protein
VLWRTFPEEFVTPSEGGAVATQALDEVVTPTTTGTELTEGKHYWEVELLPEKVRGIFVGISRPNPDNTGGGWGGSYFQHERALRLFLLCKKTIRKSITKQGHCTPFYFILLDTVK